MLLEVYLVRLDNTMDDVVLGCKIERGLEGDFVIDEFDCSQLIWNVSEERYFESVG